MFAKAAVAAGDGCDSDGVDETAASSCSRADCGRSILSPTRDDGISEEGSTDSWLDQFSTGEVITEMQGNFSFPLMKMQVMVMVVGDGGGLVKSCGERDFEKTRWSQSGGGGNSMLPRLPIIICEVQYQPARSFEKHSVKGDLLSALNQVPIPSP